MRYFAYRYQNPGFRRELGNVTGKVYWFKYGEVTEVEDQDGDYFLYLGVPDMGNYPFRELDSNGNPVGPYPPVVNRYSNLDPRQYPTDTGVPGAAEWRLQTETMADPVLYFHHIREKRRGF